MKISNFEWIYHGKNKKKKIAIFSIDIQPFGNSIITAGQDGLIKIWKNFLLFSGDKFFDFKHQKKNDYALIKIHVPTFILPNYEGQVNIIKWAVNGNFFASGGDNGFINIYERVKNPNQKEMWRIIYNSKIHTGDIVDLAWSPNSLLLSSASLDNTVLIWALDRKTTIIKLMGHTSWVKGVCWDPMGNFLATHGVEQKIFIWNTRTWEITKILYLSDRKISKKNDRKIDLFSRSCWSTCGDYLIICNTSYCTKSTILLFSRSDEFRKVNCTIGEIFFSRIVTSSPRLYKNLNSASISSIFSSGSTGGKSSLWNPIVSKPILTIFNFNKSQIVDMSWSYCGYCLYISYLDGSTAGLEFQDLEVGKILKKNEHHEFLKTFFLKFKLLDITNKLFSSSKKFCRMKNLEKIEQYGKLFFLEPTLLYKKNSKILSTKFSSYVKNLVARKNLKFFRSKNLLSSEKPILIRIKKKLTKIDKNFFSFSLYFRLIDKSNTTSVALIKDSSVLYSKFYPFKLIFLIEKCITKSLIFKKKNTFLWSSKIKDQTLLLLFSKICYASVQQIYLKITECNGNFGIINIETLSRLHSINTIDLLCDVKLLYNYIRQCIICTSGGLFFFRIKK